MQNDKGLTMGDLFGGEVVSGYTRAQAIEDGVLVDLMQGDMGDVARHHYRHPVACTAAVFDVMRRAVENKRHCNDYAGVLHDMLWMSKRHIVRRLSESAVEFVVIITGAARNTHWQFKLQVGPGDKAEPVITILMPDED